MAVVFRLGSLKGIAVNGNTILCATAISTKQSRGIAGKVMRQGLKDWPVRPKPFPYNEKFYNLPTSWIDRTSHRFTPNTKLIVVEGPIAAGKTDLAKQLADDLDMKHFPEPTMDMFYINEYGFDMRSLDPKLPEDCRSFDHVNYCKDPTHRHVANFQIMMYGLRFEQYIDALAHILNTGQGAILERSPFSDFVFVEAMVKCNFMSQGAKSVYNDIKQNTITDLFRPHLVIYLDIPASVVQEKVKKRNLAHEKDSKVMSLEYLTAMEKNYKQKYLKEISVHSELLVYDWSAQGETEVVVEDIERIDFDRYEHYDKLCQDWRMVKEQQWADARMLFTNHKHDLCNNMNVPRYDVPELMTSAEDCYDRFLVYSETPGLRYEYGYDPKMGDTNLLFKNKLKKFSTELF